jgi:hypothetical protein
LHVVLNSLNAQLKINICVGPLTTQRKMSLKAPTSGRFSTQAAASSLAAPTRRMTTAPGNAKAAQPAPFQSQTQLQHAPAAKIAPPLQPHAVAAPAPAAKTAAIAKPTASHGTVPVARRATLAATDRKVRQYKFQASTASAILMTASHLFS